MNQSSLKSTILTFSWQHLLCVLVLCVVLGATVSIRSDTFNVHFLPARSCDAKRPRSLSMLVKFKEQRVHGQTRRNCSARFTSAIAKCLGVFRTAEPRANDCNRLLLPFAKACFCLRCTSQRRAANSVLTSNGSHLGREPVLPKRSNALETQTSQRRVLDFQSLCCHGNASLRALWTAVEEACVPTR